MARYIDETDVYKLVEPRGVAKVHCSQIDELPRADVVPKSEVVNTLDELMKEMREIAERYEKSANETSNYDYARIEYRGCEIGALLAVFKIAELKKKYAENENG